MKHISNLTRATHHLLRLSPRAIACASLLAALICLALPVTALAQACPPNPPINITQTSETKQNTNFCQGQTATYDEIEDFPVFIGSCVVAIDRFINHVTEVSTSTAPACQVVGAGGNTITQTSTTSTSSATETKQNPNLCQGETRTYDVVLTQVTVQVTTSTVQIGSLGFGTNTNFNTNTNTHTLHVTEVGTKSCATSCPPNTPINVTQTTETRQSATLCQGQTRKFDEIEDVPIFVGSTCVAIDRLITHVTEVGTKNCSCPPNTPVNITQTSETRQSAFLCQGQTRTFDEITDTPIFSGSTCLSIERVINHVTEVGTLDCSKVPVNITEGSETRQNPNLCQGQTRKFDEFEDVPLFIGNILISIERFINHVTEVGTLDCSKVPINIFEDTETRQNPNLCQGQTKTFDEIQDVQNFTAGVLTSITRFITHVTEVGTKQCELPPRCRFSLLPQSASFSPTGGHGSFELKVEKLDPDADCKWSAAPLANWIEITSANSGQDSATIEFTVKPNYLTGRRQGAIRVAGEATVLNFSVDQTNNPLQVSLNDPAVCLTAGGVVGVTAYVGNQSAAPLNFNFTAALPPQLLGLAGSCSTPVGSCSINASTVTWSGTLAPGQTIPINYQAQIAPGTPNSTVLTINNSVTFGNNQMAALPLSFAVTCPNASAAAQPQFCGASSFVVPRLTHGATKTPDFPNGDLFLLPQPLTLTITSSDLSDKTYPVTAATSGHFNADARTGFLSVATRGLWLRDPNAVIRAVSCQDSFRAISFEIASTGAIGDKVRLFRQNPDGSGVQELAVFTLQAGGVNVTQLHPQAALYFNNRLAAGAGQLTANSFIAFEAAAGAAFESAAASANGRRTGLITLALSDSLSACFQFGADLSRASDTGSLALILTDVVVNRNLLPGDAAQPASGLISGTADSVPTGVPCAVACPVCPPPPLPNECVAVCFASPDRYRTNLKNLPNGLVWNFGELTRTSNTTAMTLGLQDGTSPSQRLNRGYLAAQLSLLQIGSSGVRAQRSPLSCYGLQFTPVILSNGVVLAPNITLGELLEQAQQVMSRKHWADAAALAAIFELLNRCQ